MLIAHISDFHVFADRKETALVREDSADTARLVVADLVSLNPALDAVVLTGDLTDGGSAADYALLKEILSPLACPVFLLPGNHDKREALRAAFRDKLPFEKEGFLHYEARLGGIRILALDTLVEGRGEGYLCAARREWIGARLAEPHDGHTIVALHHPPFPSGIASLDPAILVEGADELGRMVRAAQSDVRVLCGHLHRPVQTVWNGRFAAIAASSAFQFELDLTGRREEPAVAREPYAYSIHRFGPRGNSAIHTRFVRLP